MLTSWTRYFCSCRLRRGGQKTHVDYHTVEVQAEAQSGLRSLSLASFSHVLGLGLYTTFVAYSRSRPQLDNTWSEISRFTGPLVAAFCCNVLTRCPGSFDASTGFLDESSCADPWSRPYFVASLDGIFLCALSRSLVGYVLVSRKLPYASYPNPVLHMLRNLSQTPGDRGRRLSVRVLLSPVYINECLEARSKVQLL